MSRLFDAELAEPEDLNGTPNLDRALGQQVVLVEYAGTAGAEPVHRYEPADSPHPGGRVVSQPVRMPHGAELNNYRHPMAGFVGPFKPSRDLPAALDEAKATVHQWGSLNVLDPLVSAALAVAEISERHHHEHSSPYQCDDCEAAGERPTFRWAGALFVHFLTCPNFAKDLAR